MECRITIGENAVSRHLFWTWQWYIVIADGMAALCDTIRLETYMKDTIGSPRYVRFLFDDQKKHLAVQVCSPQESGAIRVSVEKRKINYISSLVMLRLVWKVCNWEKKDTLRCYGKIYKKNQVVDFDLNNAERITEEEFMAENE